MASTGIMQWLAINRNGDVDDFMKGCGLTLDEANARVLALECEGMIEHFAYRWDGSPVYRLIMQTEHNAEEVMESAEESGILLIDDGDDGWY